MKIGIMGGTFDPIHNGHLMLGRYARDLYELDEVWFMPNGNPPHKMGETIETTIKHRVEMVKKAIENEKKFALQLYEVNRKEINYSYLTLEHFRNVYPEYEFYFIVGADSLFSLEKWVHPEKLLKTCVVLAAYRDGKNTVEMERQIACLREKYQADIRLLNTPDVDISSSEIRNRVKEHLPIENMVPQVVAEYINQHKLFQNKLDLLKDEICQNQNNARFQHTIGVMNTAVALAERYQADTKSAELVGLLHDCAKSFTNDEKLKLCETYKLPISETERKNPGLLHAKLGAYLAKEKYEITDEEVLNAIKWHTTGRPNMTLLDKIIYVADYIEPNRDQAPNLGEIRRLAMSSLDECLFVILEASLEYLRANSEVIDPMTEQTYLYYKKQLNK